MQKVVNWNLQDAIPMLTGPTIINPDVPVRVDFSAGVNRYSWQIQQGGNPPLAVSVEYGVGTAQFSELAELWSTYSNRGVTVEFTPNMQGSGVQSAILTAIDTAGNQDVNNALPWEDKLVLFSRLRSFKTHSTFGKPIRMHVDYSRWLKDTVPQQFLQTVDPNVPSQRVFYPEGDNNTAPIIRFAYEVVLGESISARTLLGFFRVNARFEVRGRRGLPLGDETLVALYSERKRRSLFNALVAQYGIQCVSMAQEVLKQ